MVAAGMPRSCARMGRRSRLAKPRGRSRKTHRAGSRAWTRGPPRRRPATRVPVSVIRGSQVWRMAAWPSAGSQLSSWTSSRRRVAVKPAARRAGRLWSRLPMPKSTRVVDGRLSPQRFPFLVVLLYFRMLVVDVQGGDHALGDDPGAEPARRGPRPLADDPPAEDEPHLVRAADVQVAADHLLEEDPPVPRPIRHLGRGELGLQHRDLIPVPSTGVFGIYRARTYMPPPGGQAPDDVLVERIADRLHRGSVIDGGEPVV